MKRVREAGREGGIEEGKGEKNEERERGRKRRRLGDVQCGCWELNPGPLPEGQYF